MAEVLQNLAALKTDLDEINKCLDDFEHNSVKRGLADAAMKMKAVAPKLKELKSDPRVHTPEIAPLVADLNNGFKEAFQRAKTLKDTSSSSSTTDSSKQHTAPPPPPPATSPTPTKSPITPPMQPSPSPLVPEVKPSESLSSARSPPPPQQTPPIKTVSPVPQSPSQQEERMQKRKELQETIAKEGEAKRQEELAAKAAKRQAEFSDAMAAQSKMVSAGDDDDNEGTSAATTPGVKPGSLSLTLPGLSGGKQGKDVWSLVIKQREEQRQKESSAEAKSDEYTAIFFGGKASGKTTLIAAFLDKSMDKEASTALEYSFGRRTRGGSMSREVVHCWEIAGGTRLNSLLDVCLTPEHATTTTLALVVDLSMPSRMMDVLLNWTECIRSRVDYTLKTLSKLHPQMADSLNKAAAERIPATHPDRPTLRPIVLPTLLVCNKYDKFQDMDPEQRKVVSRTLRFVAHLYGMTLLYVTAKDEGKFLTRFRSHMNNSLFGTAIPDMTAVTQHTKPLIVHPGQDTFEAIGRPGAGEGSGMGIPPTLIAWREAFDRVFPPSDTEETERVSVDDAEKYKEPSIDTVVVEKEQEISRNQRLLAEVNSIL